LSQVADLPRVSPTGRVEAKGNGDIVHLLGLGVARVQPWDIGVQSVVG
jgi:hypothetical protein